MPRVDTRPVLRAAAIPVLGLTFGLMSGSLAATAQQAASPPDATAPAVKPSEAPVAAPSPQIWEGVAVFTSDGTKVGEVRAISTGPNGDVVALHVRTGGFLGFGGRTIIIPGERFTRSGPNLIRLDLNSEQVEHLPEIKD